MTTTKCVIHNLILTYIFFYFKENCYCELSVFQNQQYLKHEHEELILMATVYQGKQTKTVCGFKSFSNKKEIYKVANIYFVTKTKVGSQSISQEFFHLKRDISSIKLIMNGFKDFLRSVRTGTILLKLKTLHSFHLTKVICSISCSTQNSST